jgi:hypothetical protein
LPLGAGLELLRYRQWIPSRQGVALLAPAGLSLCVAEGHNTCLYGRYITVNSPPLPMPTATRRSLPKRDRRRALELLASCRDGCTEAMMLAHGFTVPQMVELVRAGLATATAERVRAGKREMGVARVKITDAGRRALAGARR